MPEVSRNEPFVDRVNIVLDELSLGIQWDRPSLIVIVYRSEHIKNRVQAILGKSLGKSGQAVFNYVVDKSHYDIPLELLNHPKHKRVVYFVGGLRWGGGRGYSNALRALNMHREYFVEGNIRVIFWLTIIEAKQLARFAPDFWAFRHKVVEFLELPSQHNNPPSKLPNGSFHNLYTRNETDFQLWINTAEQYYAMGCLDEAILNFRKALRKYPDQAAINLQIAEIYLLMGQAPAASRILKKVNKGKPDSINFLRELNRLNLAASVFHQPSGGISE
jgi:tetratricopeptide (TPR) repeat protein